MAAASGTALDPRGVAHPSTLEAGVRVMEEREAPSRLAKKCQRFGWKTDTLAFSTFPLCVTLINNNVCPKGRRRRRRQLDEPSVTAVFKHGTSGEIVL